MSRGSMRRLGVWLCNALAKRYGKPARRPERAPLDELLITVLADEASETAAMRAYRDLGNEFVDWNEVRVSSVHEIEHVLDSLPEAETKAVVIKTVLTDVFSERHQISLDFLRETRPEAARRFLLNMQGVTEQAAARVLLYGLDHPAVFVNVPVMRVLRRVGLMADETTEVEAQRLLEKAMPEERKLDLHELLAEHARRTCLAGTPRCSRCPIRQRCRFRRQQRRTSRRRPVRPKGVAKGRRRSRGTR